MAFPSLQRLLCLFFLWLHVAFHLMLLLVTQPTSSFSCAPNAVRWPRKPFFRDPSSYSSPRPPPGALGTLLWGHFGSLWGSSMVAQTSPTFPPESLPAQIPSGYPSYPGFGAPGTSSGGSRSHFCGVPSSLYTHWRVSVFK